MTKTHEHPNTRARGRRVGHEASLRSPRTVRRAALPPLGDLSLHRVHEHPGLIVLRLQHLDLEQFLEGFLKPVLLIQQLGEFVAPGKLEGLPVQGCPVSRQSLHRLSEGPMDRRLKMQVRRPERVRLLFEGGEGLLEERPTPLSRLGVEVQGRCEQEAGTVGEEPAKDVVWAEVYSTPVENLREVAIRQLERPPPAR